MNISQAGIDLLKSLEGFRDKPYNDSAGFSTVGYGTLLHRGPVSKDNLLDKQYAGGISVDEAERLLRCHLRVEVEPVISRSIKVSLTQNQYDSLCCFAYNVGSSAFEKSTLAKLLNLGSYAAVPEQMMKWIMAGGHVSEGLKNRREQEIALWQKTN
jgi:lysozyme